MASVNTTRAFFGDEAGASVRLDGMNGLWGGRRIYVSRAGRTVAQVVSRTKHEQRYEFTLDEARVRSLFAACVENDLLTVPCSERPGIPDETCLVVTLVNGAGERRAVHRWAGDRQARFDGVCALLSQIEALTAGRTPTYSGPFAWEYVPEGF